LFREKGHVAFVDVFMELGYLDPKDYVFLPDTDAYRESKSLSAGGGLAP